MQSTNPVLSRRDAFSTSTTSQTGWGDAPVWNNGPTTPGGITPGAYAPPTRMTLDSVVQKTGLLLGILLVTGAVTWTLGLEALAFPAVLIGLVLALVITFKRSSNPGLIIAYAAVEGVFIGGISKLFEAQYSGIVLQAAVGTALCFGTVLALYSRGVLRATPRFTKMIIASMVGIFAMYMVNLLLSVFGSSVPGLNSSGPFGVIVSLVIVAVASLSFVLDFDMIERAVAQGAPEKESWRAGFGLVVGLVWLYIEMLRLLSKLRN